MVFDHVSFAVESIESLCALRETLDAAGFWVSDVIDHGIIYSVYSFDPNGIPIEFSAAVPDADLGAFPALVDTDPPAAALEGPEPVPGVWPGSPGPTATPDCLVFPGEGRELVDGSKKNWFK
jgi:hypothetical protein